jgi:uncharacterized protein (TIGR01777 family)
VDKNILITGASGLIGTPLMAMLQERGKSVAHLSRTTGTGEVQTFLWDIDKHRFDEAALKSTESIIHLAGASIADKPWTKERKHEILASRIHSTRLLYDNLRKRNHNVKTFVSASAIGYYGFDDNGKVFDEKDRQGEGFLAEVVHQWEKSVDQIATLGIRVVKIRIGIVLSEKGGALKELIRPLKLYVGSPLGSGMQYVSWIHLNDLCRIFVKAIEDHTMEGVYNAVAPHPVPNKEFTHVCADVLHKPILLPNVPAFVLKVLLGEMADLVLKGAKVSSEKIQSTGFKFQYTELEEALKDLLT